jgi:hypothetical protein
MPLPGWHLWLIYQELILKAQPFRNTAENVQNAKIHHVNARSNELDASAPNLSAAKHVVAFLCG